MYLCIATSICVCVCVSVSLCVTFMHVGKEGMVGKQTARLTDEVQRVQFDRKTLAIHFLSRLSLHASNCKDPSSISAWLCLSKRKRKR